MVSIHTADRGRRLGNSELIFSEQMFSALIRLSSFLRWSILNLKEKSGRVLIPFQVMLWTNTLVLKTHCLANIAMKGDIQARKYWELVCSEPLLVVDIINILRTYIWETKIILSCLFLLEAHGLELYYRPIRIKYHGNMHITWHICWPNVCSQYIDNIHN